MERRRIVVIGGGISGLAAAHRLAELSRGDRIPVSLTLLEAQPRLGGVIDSSRHDGFLLEGGPDAFLSEKPWALTLCRRLGLDGDLVRTREACRRSFIVRRNRLVPIPAGFELIAPVRLSTLWRAPIMSWRGRLRMACEPFIHPGAQGEDESVGGFIRRRFGREALARIGQPMLAGMYAADPECLSLAASLPRLREMEREHGSVLRALRVARRARLAPGGGSGGPRYELFLTLRGGMRTLIDRLIERMLEVEVRCAAPVARLERMMPQGRWRVWLEHAEFLDADSVCVALPAHEAARLMRQAAPDAASELARIPSESVATVNVAFRRADVRHPMDGFGFVVPDIEGRRIIGCTFASVKFQDRAPDGWVLLRAFLGGARHRESLERDDAALGEMVREELRDLLGIQARPRFVRVHRWPHAMPQYQVGHLARVAALKQTLRASPGLSVIGNAYRGIGIPDCIRQAEEAAERIWRESRPAARDAAVEAARREGA